MNCYLNKTALKVILGLTGAFFIYIFSKYAVLSFTPVGKISQKSQTVERGSIVDRSGKPLAVQTNFYHVGVTPHLIKNKEQFSQDIAGALGLTPSEVFNLISKNDKASFIYLKKKVDETVYSELKKITMTETTCL